MRRVTEREESNGPRPITILVVEDNADSAAALGELLGIYGYRVTLAASVREALERVDDADVLISDITLPDGSGRELMRQVAKRRVLHGIALSGLDGREEERRSIAAGFAHHVVKPIDPERLVELIKEVCGAPVRAK